MINKKSVTLAALTISSALLLSACSSAELENLKDSVVKELETVASSENKALEEEPGLPVVNSEDVENVGMDFADTPENREIAASVLQDMFNDIASFEVEDEQELLAVEKNVGMYTNDEISKILGNDSLEEAEDTESFAQSLSEDEKNRIISGLVRYNPQPGISNFEHLNDEQKIVALQYLGNRKTEFNYQYRLHELTNPTEYTVSVDKDKMVFRDNDIIVFPEAISHNHNDVDFTTEDFYNYRIVIEEGRYVVDIFHTALTASSPLITESAFAVKPEKKLEVTDKVLNRQW